MAMIKSRLGRCLEAFGIRANKKNDDTKETPRRRGRAPTITINTDIAVQAPSLSPCPVSTITYDLAKTGCWSVGQQHRPDDDASIGSANSSLESLQNSISSQVSDGSIDGTLSAFQDLVDDHVKLLGRRSHEKDAEGRRRYIKALQVFRTAVETHKQSVTGRNTRREDALILLYHDVAREFTGLITELSKSAGSSGRKKINPGLSSTSAPERHDVIYPHFVNRLEDLQKRFEASMILPSPLPLFSEVGTPMTLILGRAAAAAQASRA